MPVYSVHIFLYDIIWSLLDHTSREVNKKHGRRKGGMTYSNGPQPYAEFLWFMF